MDIIAEATAATHELRAVSAEQQKLANKWTKAPQELTDRANAAKRRYHAARKAYYAHTGESLNIPA